jgi:pimeloyl-ACP methyl ester carboxylesterase
LRPRPTPGRAAPRPAVTRPAPPVIHYRTATVDGVKVFYREAGPADGPVVLLLHGFPTSSHMFRNLIPLLADKYRVIAPDYPGYGQSDAPDHTKFAYTFANQADIVDKLVTQLGAKRYAIYVMDYGAPIGYRLALKHPERVSGLIVQNGNAYKRACSRVLGSDQGLLGRPLAEEPRRAERPGHAGHHQVPVHRRHGRRGAHQPRQLGPRPGAARPSGQPRHPAGHARRLRLQRAALPAIPGLLPRRQPPTLIVWGKNDKIFPEAGAHPYLRDLPKAEMHILDTGPLRPGRQARRHGAR